MRTVLRRSRWGGWWTWALLLPAAAAPLRSAAQSTPIELPGPVEPAPAAPPAGPAADRTGQASGRQDPPEFYVALVAGTARHDAASVSATIQGILGPDSTATGQVALGSSDLLGLRVGLWGSGPSRHFGVAFDLQHLASSGSDSANGAQLKFDALTFAVVPAFRIQFLPARWAPAGAVDLYGGLGLGLVIGSATVSAPALPHPVSDSAATGWSIALLAGVTVRLPYVLLFGELRTGPTRVNIAGGDFSFEEGSAAFDSTTAVVGVGVRF
jgi:hypothetical protein